MSIVSATADIPETDRPRLLALEVDGRPGLEHAVRLELSGQCTVLVGKNGAGKSLLIEGIFQATNKIFSPFPGQISAPSRSHPVGHIPRRPLYAAAEPLVGERVVHGALAKDRETRPLSCSTLVRALRESFAG